MRKLPRGARGRDRGGSYQEEQEEEMGRKLPRGARGRDRGRKLPRGARGRDRGRKLPRGARGRARGGGEARGRTRDVMKVRGQELDGERGKPQGRLMAVGRTRVICRTRGGIPTPARGVRTRDGARAAQNVACVNNVAVVNEVTPDYCCIYCQEKYTDPPTEEWLQCRSCAEGYREACGSPFGVCDICDS